MDKNQAAIFLAPGFEMAEAVITIDVLRRANIDLDIIAVNEKLLVKSQNGLVIKAEKLIDNINFSNYQTLILPGGLTGVCSLSKNQKLKDAILKANQESKLIAAICAAPQILGQLGILNNKKITVYPGCVLGLEHAIVTTDEVVISQNIITGKAVGSTFQFALAIVAAMSNQENSKSVQNKMYFIN